MPKDADCAASLKQRTLTNLYNQRPAWLDLAHKKLDAAVFAAYGWDPGMSDDDLWKALGVELRASGSRRPMTVETRQGKIGGHCHNSKWKDCPKGSRVKL